MKESKYPFFSIVIPTYQRPERLESCLQAITRLDYPTDRFEVVVVDDGSKVGPDKIVAPFAARVELTLLRGTHNGPAAARNDGAARAKGEFLAFTDDDCIPLPDWLQAFSKRFTNTPECLIGGLTINGLPNNPYSSASQLLCDYIYACYNADHNNAQFLTSNNLALKRKHFTMSGGFDTDFCRAGGEDREFSSRWLRHGYRIIYAPEAAVLHTHSLTFNTFFRQHLTYGRGAFLFHRKQNDSCGSLTIPGHFSFYSGLLGSPYLLPLKRKKLLFGSLFMVSQVAVAAGYFLERMKRDPERGKFRFAHRSEWTQIDADKRR